MEGESSSWSVVVSEPGKAYQDGGRSGSTTEPSPHPQGSAVPRSIPAEGAEVTQLAALALPGLP